MAVTKQQFPNTWLNASVEIYTDSIDLASVAANTTANQEVTASTTGLLKVGDYCIILDQGAINAGLAVDALPVATVDKFKFKVHNLTAGALDAAPTNMTFLVIHVGTLN